MEKSCNKCMHQSVCDSFRKIEATLLDEDTFNKSWHTLDQVYTALARSCSEYVEK